MDEKESLARARARCGEVIGNNYVLGDMLGIGGMGVVHVALQRSLDRTVAVKLPRPELAHDAQVRRRFRNEALAGSRINHRNIVRVLDFGDQHGMPAISSWSTSPGRGSVNSSKKWARSPIWRRSCSSGEIVAGLEDAHADGIVRANLKCDNILVETLRDTALPRVIKLRHRAFIDEHRRRRLNRSFTAHAGYSSPE